MKHLSYHTEIWTLVYEGRPVNIAMVLEQISEEPPNIINDTKYSAQVGEYILSMLTKGKFVVKKNKWILKLFNIVQFRSIRIYVKVLMPVNSINLVLLT